MHDLLRRMAEVANEMDEVGAAGRASRVDQMVRQLTAQIGEGFGNELAPDPYGDEGGLEEEISDADVDTQLNAKLRAMTPDQKRDLLTKGLGQIGANGRQMATRPTNIPTA